MALNETALSELLDTLHAGDSVDLVRELAQWALRIGPLAANRSFTVMNAQSVEFEVQLN